ncbi:TPA: hypothetical protein N0F65_011774 [Lagenidium giganteum]|uniref:ATP-dependent DNA helicase n=1 Tax=Lagenidium giganteum TaxID=4803 RepID=A0AAV2YFF0_9STRA|nr:TPA: hypothetical protein N0F65_011774 [Lagenidium giganteum]
MNRIVLAVAPLGLAATLIRGGKTAHFKEPMEVHESSTCNIPVESPLAKLIYRASIIVWNETSMNHKFVLEAVNRTIARRIQLHDAIWREDGHFWW